MIPSINAASADRRPNWALALVGVFLIVLFYPTGRQLVDVWLLDANYSHGFLILPLSAWLAWRVVREHPVPETGEPGLGLFTMTVGLGLHAIGVVLRFLPLEWVTWMLILRGTAVTLGGRAWADRFLFPMLFLTFLFPLPVALTSQLAVALQDIVAEISAETLSLFFYCYRRGNNIYLAGVEQPMFVAQECSGVRQIMAFVALGALFAYLSKTGLARGLVIVALAVPVAIAANVARVILMGLGLITFGPTWFSTWMHDVPALFTLPLGILCFFVLVWAVAPSTPVAPSSTAAKESS